MGSEHHTFHVHGHRWMSPVGTDVDTQTVGPAETLPHPLARGGPRHVAVPLPRRGPHDGRDDRHLPGQAPMRRLALALGAALAALAGAGAPRPRWTAHGTAATAAPTPRVSIQFAAFAPPRIDVLAGDTVRWTNDSVRVHTVTADDGSWASGRARRRRQLQPPLRRARATSPTTACLHPFMRGEVDVHNVLLARADRARRARAAPYVLHGRSALPAGTDVSDRGRHRRGLPAGRPRPPSRPTARSPPTSCPSTTATYRAVAGGEASPAVQLLVLDRKVAATRARPRPRRDGQRARRARPRRARPSSCSCACPQHFGWWPVARAKLDHALDGALLAAPAPIATRRASCSRCADGATALAVSRTLHVGPR